MRQQFTGGLQNLQRTFSAFTAGQKTVAVIGGLALVLAGVMVFRWASTPAYAPLFTNMAAEDASAVVDQLDASGTRYQLADGGNTIMVPRDAVYDTRIQLSGEGLPSSSGDGYSLLDNQSLSTSQFQEQTCYKRAIEGELERTIEALDPVQTAVVHVAMPQEELFESDVRADHRVGPGLHRPRRHPRHRSGAGRRPPRRLQRRRPRPQAGHRHRRHRSGALGRRRRRRHRRRRARPAGQVLRGAAGQLGRHRARPGAGARQLRGPGDRRPQLRRDHHPDHPLLHRPGRDSADRLGDDRDVHDARRHDGRRDRRRRRPGR